MQRMLDQKISQISESIASANESRNSDTKSSAGDKFETSREMIQQEIDRYEAQLAKLRAQRYQVESIDLSQPYSKVAIGSLVTTSKGLFFMSTALGKLKMDETTVMCISLASPIGIAMRDKLAGDSAQFGNQDILIETIE